MQTHSEFPKVLILNQPFDNITGGGITLTNLFEGYRNDKLAVVCSGYLLSSQTNFKICSKYYQVGHLEYKWRFPFSLLKRKYYSGEIKEIETASQEIKEKVPSASLRMRLINDIFYPFLKKSGLYYFLTSQKLSKKFCDWLDEYDPDIIYCQASSRDSILFCKMVHQYLNKPMIFHMMDDWPTMLKSESYLGNYWFKRVEKDFKSLFEKSSALLSISDLMAKEYKVRYERDFITFHNPIAIDFWKKYRKPKSKLNSPPVILYAGRVGTGIESSLEVIAKAVELVNTKTGIGLQFALQTPEAPKWISKYKNTRHNPFVAYEELPRVFSDADLLILPYDFEDKGLNFIRLSMPTKAPEYLASGTPVIIFSPKSTAVVEYSKKNECGFPVVENSSEFLSETIIKLLNDDNLRVKLSENGMKVTEKFHNAEIVRTKFQSILRELANRN